MTRSVFASVCVALGLVSCSSGEWASKSNGLRQPMSFCLISKSSDVVAKGRIVSVSTPQVLSFAVWPGRHNATPVSVEIKKDLRGRLAPGNYPMWVGAPVSSDGREVETFDKTPIGVDGWLTATMVEGKWILGLGGLVTVEAPSHAGAMDAGVADPGLDAGLSDTSPSYKTRLGTFAREEEYEAAQRAAFVACPRVNYLVDDGRRADWISSTNVQSTSLDAGR